MADNPYPYCIWRRSDGYVGCTTYQQRNRGSQLTFEILLETQNWDEARGRMIIERQDPRHISVVDSWQ